jgi:hypothetical protein
MSSLTLSHSILFIFERLRSEPAHETDGRIGVGSRTGQDIIFLPLFLVDTGKGRVLRVLCYYKGNEQRKVLVRNDVWG